METYNTKYGKITLYANENILEHHLNKVFIGMNKLY